MKQYYIGLDIGGTKCCVLLGTVGGGIRILEKLRFETQTEKGFADTYRRLKEGIGTVLAKHRLTMQADVQAIGISCGGPLDSKRGVVLCPPNLPGWVDIPLTEMLTRDFGVPAYLQNDANACALVEWKLGAGRGCNDMIFLTMGTGMGGGIISEGRLVCGATGMGGEVGHLRLTEDGPVGFGKHGSFEGYTSGGGIQRQAQALTQRLIEAGTPPAWADLPPEQIDCRLMAEYARRGDGQARAFFETVGTMLGKGLALLVDTLNPERIVIGSIFVRCEELLRPAMEQALRAEAVPQAYRDLQILPAETGEALGDLASIMAALYAEDIDPMAVPAEEAKPAYLNENGTENARVLEHFERLFARYPVLEPNREQILQAYRILAQCYDRGGKVMVVGNGGSCADCEHIVGELMKGFYLKRPLDEARKQALRLATDAILPGVADRFQQGLPAIALTGHAALSTAVQNDCDPEMAPAQQVLGYGRAGDTVIGISTSGNAKNVALAVATARALGLSTIGLTGGSGGRLLELCDQTITVPTSRTADVQELHLPVYHTLCAMLEARYFLQ